MQLPPKTEAQLIADERERMLLAKQERVAYQKQKEINRRLKNTKTNAKYLASRKGADKIALEYERDLLLIRLEDIDKALAKERKR